MCLHLSVCVGRQGRGRGSRVAQGPDHLGFKSSLYFSCDFGPGTQLFCKLTFLLRAVGTVGCFLPHRAAVGRERRSPSVCGTVPAPGERSAVAVVAGFHAPEWQAGSVRAPGKGRGLGTSEILPADEKPRPREGQVGILAKKL